MDCRQLDLESRRRFLQAGACMAAAACLPRFASAQNLPTPGPAQPALHEALWYDKLADGSVRCSLCPKSCVVPPGQRGACRVRENRAGSYYSLVYARPCALHVDPIEKKPLFHYLPGSSAFSLATAGCNFTCKFCQNWDIAQARPEDLQSRPLSPQDLVDACRKDSIPTLAFTYSEPTVFSEYVLDTARLARANSLGAVTISNGFISRKPLVDLCQHLTAVKIDLKAFTDDFYRDVCSGRLQPVLDTLATLRDLRIHFEIVTLLIPTLNDAKDDLRRMTAWIVKELGPDVPVHFTRFQPAYRLTNLPPTPLSTLENAHDLARDAGINYCYLGNVGPHKWANTWCPKCQTLLIDRYGNLVRRNDLADGKCPKCGLAVPGVWSPKQALAFKPVPLKS